MPQGKMSGRGCDLKVSQALLSVCLRVINDGKYGNIFTGVYFYGIHSLYAVEQCWKETSMQNMFDEFMNNNKYGLNNDDALFDDFYTRADFLRLVAATDNDGNLIPDTTSADKYFIEGFITDDMAWEFNDIGHEFLLHHFSRLREFDGLAYYDNDSIYQSNQETAFQRRIMNIIYNAAKSGDEYSVELIKYLYKTFHKKEYKQLKKFSVISMLEISSIVNDSTDREFLEGLARILAMCGFMDIKMDRTVAFSYLYLDKARKEMRDDISDEELFYEFPEGLYKECSDQIDEWIHAAETEFADIKGHQQFRKINKTYTDAHRFMELAFSRCGYPTDFDYKANTSFTGVYRLFCTTLALLKAAYPKREYSFEDVQQYSHILMCVEALAEVCDYYDNSISELLGICETDASVESDGDRLFNPEMVRTVKQKSVDIKSKPVYIKPLVENESAKTDDLLEEIASLRKTVADKEREYNNLKHQYMQTKKELSEKIMLVEEFNSDHEELVALRNTVYELTKENQQEETDENTPAAEMRKVISDKRIIIIGGNDNWIKKLKNEFPKWKYISANVSGAIEGSVVLNADMVYIFTDTLGHSSYYKFIKLIRDNNVSFRYIHGVNIEGNIRQIYKDFA